jgi:putative heme-binding domain-containing protein
MFNKCLFPLVVTVLFFVGEQPMFAQDADPIAIEAYRARVLSESGDPIEGRKIYENKAKSRCEFCHAVEGKGNVLGPDLLGVGSRYDQAGLLESILNPSAKIHPDYAGTIVTTVSGKVFTGLLRPLGDNEAEIAINETEVVRLKLSEIDDRKPSLVSTMPAGLHERLTPTEMSGLIAYLSQLRSTVPGTLQDARDPREIPRASVGVQFEPMLERDQAMRRPVWFGAVPGQPGVFAAIEFEHGRIWIFRGEPGRLQRTLFADLSSETRRGELTGIMSIAFHPEYMRNRRYFVKLHSPTSAGPLTVNIVERKASADGLSDSGEPSQLRLKIPVFSEIHNGGDLAFGPDGFLYIGMGDTGPQEDPRGHGQDLNVLLGKILRIDVDRTDGELPYAVPSDNPFRDRPHTRPEIWVYGLREPWRISFDGKTGDLWIGDVGQNRFEEVAIVRAGENHGWNVFEGFQPQSSRFSSKDSKYVPPIFAYNHAVGPSVTGGFVYRGNKSAALTGRYIFGDFESRRVWALDQVDRKIKSIIQIGRAPDRIVSFGMGHDDELYTVGYDQGQIYHLDLSEVDVTPSAFPRELVATSRTEPQNWKFDLERPNASWFQPEFDDSNWKSGPGGFGTRGTPGGTIRTEWRSGDIWMRREFTLDSFDPRTLGLLVHHDEDAEIYLNGVLAARLPGFSRDYEDVSIEPAALLSLKSGKNLIAIHCHQTGGGQFIDAGLTTTAPAQPNR